MNTKKLPQLVLGLGAAGLLLLGSMVLIAAGLGAFSVDVYFPALAGFGLAGLMVSGLLVLTTVRGVTETDWDDFGDTETPSYTPDAFSLQLDSRARPFWVCTRCRVVEDGRGLGSCIYCNMGVAFYVIETDDDLRMVRASMG